MLCQDTSPFFCPWPTLLEVSAEKMDLKGFTARLGRKSSTSVNCAQARQLQPIREGVLLVTAKLYISRMRWDLMLLSPPYVKTLQTR